MITSFHIKNFRLFKELHIERFGRVNLIVGQNNSGKTCLLEALWVYNGIAAPSIFRRIIIQRDEFWMENMEDGSIIDPEKHPLRYIFNNYTISETIELFEHENLKIRIVSEAHNTRWENSIELSIIAGDTNLYKINLDKYDIKKRSPLKISPNLHFLFTNRIFYNEIEILWNNIILTPLENSVIDSLRLIDREIQRVGLIRNQANKEEIEIIPIVFRNDQRIPLRNLGDGMTHIFHIILALVNSQNGVLLIDEFENGLHWKIQPKVWELIFKLAEELNVQVFATTHSRDCVAGFYQAWMEQADENSGSFIRLNRPPGKEMFVTEYPRESLGNTLQVDVEMR